MALRGVLLCWEGWLLTSAQESKAPRGEGWRQIRIDRRAANTFTRYGRGK